MFSLQGIYGLENIPHFIPDIHSLRNGKYLRYSQVLLEFNYDHFFFHYASEITQINGNVQVENPQIILFF